MAKVKVVNQSKIEVGDVELSDKLFNGPVDMHLLQAMVRKQRADSRSGTASTKVRSEINGTTKKMYRQKGTGRARHSTKKAPIFVGGGIAFGPKPRDFSLRMPKKARRKALQSALSLKMQQGKITVVDTFEVETPKTKQVLSTLKVFPYDKALVVDNENNSLALSVRNLPSYKFLKPEWLNVYDLLRFDGLIITRSASEKLQEALVR